MIKDRFNVTNENETYSESDFYEIELAQPFVDKIKKIPVWVDYTQDEQMRLIKIFIDGRLAGKDFTRQEKDNFAQRLMNIDLSL